jgi:hypothetical protein
VLVAGFWAKLTDALLVMKLRWARGRPWTP